MDLVEFVIGVVSIIIAVAILVSPEFAYLIAIVLVVIGIAALADAIFGEKK
jgi:uncharacterized membrane protein HdeD (DUF308 family)